eukprot:CAMPEP_0119545808 /NCGR_PEP_ID=MMETSP1352-20130426/456_1 /TAXON_ID=265584 /ORGANISM="Stauroneis constricta, Strain CCMP1120" /LENGTH=469 /DNA_ID=CAMNT_0007590411 /DNA_START=105 /DNA_END=1514 /DNA_ORIENTATION=+
MKIASFLSSSATGTTAVLVFLTSMVRSTSAVAAPAAANDEYCPNDYTLERKLQHTMPDPQDAITIVSQDEDFVEFKVNQNYVLGSSLQAMYVNYRSEDRTYECESYEGLTSADSTSVMRAECSHTSHAAAVDVYIVDSAVTGSSPIPQCCHADPQTTPANKVAHYVYLVQCKPTCPNPQSKSCDATSLDFNDLAKDQYIHDEWWNANGRGVKITAIGRQDDTRVRDQFTYTPLPLSSKPVGRPWTERYNHNSNGTSKGNATKNLHNRSGGAARVFDTAFPSKRFGNSRCSTSKWDGDDTLGSPNEKCPAGTPGKKTGYDYQAKKNIQGPGRGWGGQPGRTSTNCPSTPLGNVIIVQERSNNCGDHSYGGGSIVFEFNPNVVGAVDFHSVQILDMNKDVKVSAWVDGDNLNGNPSKEIVLTRKGTNALVDKTFNLSNNEDKLLGIRKVKFYSTNGFSISKIDYEPSVCSA